MRHVRTSIISATDNASQCKDNTGNGQKSDRLYDLVKHGSRISEPVLGSCVTADNTYTRRVVSLDTTQGYLVSLGAARKQ